MYFSLFDYLKHIYIKHIGIINETMLLLLFLKIIIYIKMNNKKKK